MSEKPTSVLASQGLHVCTLRAVRIPFRVTQKKEKPEHKNVKLKM